MYLKLCLAAGLSAVMLTGCVVTPLDGYGYDGYTSGYSSEPYGENFSLTYGSVNRGYPASRYYNYSRPYYRGHNYYADDGYEHHHSHHDHDDYDDD